MQIKNILPALMLGALMGMSTGPVSAGVVYQATDLGVAGTTPGSQRWEYSYHVDGPFAAGDGFTLIYGPASYSNVAITQALSGDWSQLLTDGFGFVDTTLTNTALVAIANASADFKVEFDWLGIDPPGSQPYETFDASGTNVATSRTVSSSNVPEPGSLALVIGGLVLMGWRNSKLRASSTPSLS